VRQLFSVVSHLKAGIQWGIFENIGIFIGFSFTIDLLVMKFSICLTVSLDIFSSTPTVRTL